MLYCILFFIFEEIYSFNWMKKNTIRVLIRFSECAASDARGCQMEPLTNVKENRITACRSHKSHLEYVQSLTVPLSACLPTVKPTVIDVGIYVNSIGPVSSIDMVSSGFRTHVSPSPHISIIRRGLGCSVRGCGGGGPSCLRRRGETGGRASLLSWISLE